MQLGLGLQLSRSNGLRSVVSAGLDLLRRLGDRATVFAPGVAQAVGPVNLLLWSHTVSSANWGKSNVNTPSATSVVEDTATTSHLVNQTISVLAGVPATYAAIVQAGTRTSCEMRIQGGSGAAGVAVNLSTGALANIGVAWGTGFSAISASVADLGSGQYLVALNATSAASYPAAMLLLSNAGGATNYTGNGTGSINVFGQGAFQGTYTASEILAQGGIPVTTTAAAAARYSHWISGASLDPTAGTQVLGPERFVSPIVAANTWTDQGNGVYYCKANVWGNLGLSVASGSVPALLGANQRVRVRVTITGTFTNMHLWSAIDSTGSNNALAYTFTAPGSYDITVTTAAYGGLWFDSTAGMGATLSAISFQQVITMPQAAWLMDYVESTMSTPAAVDGPVGALTDGSEATAEIAPPTSSLVGWSPGGTGAQVATDGASITVTNSAASEASAVVTGVNSVANAQYLVTCELVGLVGTATAYVVIGNGNLALSGTSGVKRAVVTAPSAGNIRVAVGTATIGNAVTFKNLSIKRLTRNHAVQGTGANKPTLRRGVVALTKASDLSTGWTFGSLTQTTGQVGPTGANDASLLTVTLTNGHALYKTSESLVAGQRYTFAAEVKLGTATSVKVSVDDITSGVGQLANTEVAGQVTGGGWGIVAVPFTAANATSNAMPLFFRDCASAGQTVFVRRVAILQGEVTPAQIRACGGVPLTSTIAASSTAGNYALSNSAHFLQSGVKPGASGVLISGFMANQLGFMCPIGNILSAQTQPGVGMKLRNDGGVWMRTVGTNQVMTEATAPNVYSPNVPVVLAMTWSYPGTVTIRKNGKQQNFVTNGGDPTGTAGLNIGADGIGIGGEVFQGLLYPQIFVNGSLTESEILTLERFVAALTGPVPNSLRF